MKKLVLPTILVLLFIANTVVAQELTIENYTTNIDIQQDAVEETIIFTVVNNGNTIINSLTYSVQTYPENVVVKKDGQLVATHVEKSAQEYDIIIESPINSNSKNKLIITFATDGFITKTGDKYLFRFFYSPDTEIKNFKLRVNLPEGSKLSLLEGLPVISPQPYVLGTDGEKIFIEWTKDSLETAESFSAIIQYQSTQNQSTIIFVIIAVILGIFIGYRLKTYRKMKFIKTVLSEDENAVVKHVEKSGEILQDKLPELTGFSKTKISKIVRVLEQRQIVQKIPYRKTNKLKLKK